MGAAGSIANLGDLLNEPARLGEQLARMFRDYTSPQTAKLMRMVLKVVEQNKREREQWLRENRTLRRSGSVTSALEEEGAGGEDEQPPDYVACLVAAAAYGTFGELVWEWTRDKTRFEDSVTDAVTLLGMMAAHAGASDCWGRVDLETVDRLPATAANSPMHAHFTADPRLLQGAARLIKARLIVRPSLHLLRRLTAAQPLAKTLYDMLGRDGMQMIFNLSRDAHDVEEMVEAYRLIVHITLPRPVQTVFVTRDRLHTEVLEDMKNAFRNYEYRVPPALALLNLLQHPGNRSALQAAGAVPVLVSLVRHPEAVLVRIGLRAIGLLVEIEVASDTSAVVPHVDHIVAHLASPERLVASEALCTLRRVAAADAAASSAAPVAAALSRPEIVAAALAASRAARTPEAKADAGVLLASLCVAHEAGLAVVQRNPQATILVNEVAASPASAGSTAARTLAAVRLLKGTIEALGLEAATAQPRVPRSNSSTNAAPRAATAPGHATALWRLGGTLAAATAEAGAGAGPGHGPKPRTAEGGRKPPSAPDAKLVLRDLASLARVAALKKRAAATAGARQGLVARLPPADGAAPSPYASMRGKRSKTKKAKKGLSWAAAGGPEPQQPAAAAGEAGEVPPEEGEAVEAAMHAISGALKFLKPIRKMREVLNGPDTSGEAEVDTRARRSIAAASRKKLQSISRPAAASRGEILRKPASGLGPSPSPPPPDAPSAPLPPRPSGAQSPPHASEAPLRRLASRPMSPSSRPQPASGPLAPLHRPLPSPQLAALERAGSSASAGSNGPSRSLSPIATGPSDLPQAHSAGPSPGPSPAAAPHPPEALPQAYSLPPRPAPAPLPSVGPGAAGPAPWMPPPGASFPMAPAPPPAPYAVPPPPGPVPYAGPPPPMAAPYGAPPPMMRPLAPAPLPATLPLGPVALPGYGPPGMPPGMGGYGPPPPFFAGPGGPMPLGMAGPPMPLHVLPPGHAAASPFMPAPAAPFPQYAPPPLPGARLERAMAAEYPYPAPAPLPAAGLQGAFGARFRSLGGG